MAILASSSFYFATFIIFVFSGLIVCPTFATSACVLDVRSFMPLQELSIWAISSAKSRSLYVSPSTHLNQDLGIPCHSPHYPVHSQGKNHWRQLVSQSEAILSPVLYILLCIMISIIFHNCILIEFLDFSLSSIAIFVHAIKGLFEVNKVDRYRFFHTLKTYQFVVKVWIFVLKWIWILRSESCLFLSQLLILCRSLVALLNSFV